MNHSVSSTLWFFEICFSCHLSEELRHSTSLQDLFRQLICGDSSALTENMRQQGGTTFANLLNALRIGELKASHFAVLMSKVLTEASDDFDLDRAIRIYPTRAQFDADNTAVLERYRAK
ncbi:hypothetical protein AVEN_179589-1 [Araneus ventricosus]|uniref:Uncharacterized protein n=1 Tax=Araneus ventricosus TaxID=182803 RepID=A0A4Y2BCP6_ARAVE|nr:hypothetical protein AVEN_179589-1 [Araneus ventricosus]